MLKKTPHQVSLHRQNVSFPRYCSSASLSPPSPLSDGPRRRRPPRRPPGSCASSACSPGRSGCASSSVAGAASPPWWPSAPQPLAARQRGKRLRPHMKFREVREKKKKKNQPPPQNLLVRPADSSSSSRGREPWQWGWPWLRAAHLRVILLSPGSAEGKRKTEQCGFSIGA